MVQTLSQGQEMTAVGTIGLSAIPPSATFCRFFLRTPCKTKFPRCAHFKYPEHMQMYISSLYIGFSKFSFLSYSDALLIFLYSYLFILLYLNPGKMEIILEKSQNQIPQFGCLIPVYVSWYSSWFLTHNGVFKGWCLTRKKAKLAFSFFFF